MKQEIDLTDINKWKEVNEDGDFNSYDYIFHVFDLAKINTDIYFALSELYWPDFIRFEDYVFLREKFSEKKIKENKSSGNIEFWINLIPLDEYFKDDSNGENKAQAFSLILIDIWKTKLKRDFPRLKFRVVSLTSQTGDSGLTFYQIKNEDLS